MGKIPIVLYHIMVFIEICHMFVNTNMIMKFKFISQMFAIKENPYLKFKYLFNAFLCLQQLKLNKI